MTFYNFSCSQNDYVILISNKNSHRKGPEPGTRRYILGRTLQTINYNSTTKRFQKLVVSQDQILLSFPGDNIY